MLHLVNTLFLKLKLRFEIASEFPKHNRELQIFQVLFAKYLLIWSIKQFLCSFLL